MSADVTVSYFCAGFKIGFLWGDVCTGFPFLNVSGFGPSIFNPHNAFYTVVPLKQYEKLRQGLPFTWL